MIHKIFFWHLLSARVFQILSQSLKRIAPWNRPSYVDFAVCCPEADERRHMCVSFIPGSSSISKSGNIQHLYQRIQPCVVYEIYLLSIGASRTVLFFCFSSTLYMWSHLSNLCSNCVEKKKLWIESLSRSERHEKTDQDWSGSIFFWSHCHRLQSSQPRCIIDSFIEFWTMFLMNSTSTCTCKSGVSVQTLAKFVWWWAWN